MYVYAYSTIIDQNLVILSLILLLADGSFHFLMTTPSQFWSLLFVALSICFRPNNKITGSWKSCFWNFLELVAKDRTFRDSKESSRTSFPEVTNIWLLIWDNISSLVQSNLAIRNCSLMPKVPYPYEVNAKLVTGNGSLVPICSLSDRSLWPSLTIVIISDNRQKSYSTTR